MRKRGWWISGICAAVTLMLLSGGCDKLAGPDLTGEFILSSQLFGSESYYLFGYSYETSEFYKYPHAGEAIPDIINEGFLVIEGSDLVSRPGFNTPARVNGFALVGHFTSLEAAKNYYKGYTDVDAGLQFETVSDTVELYQVWVQQTSAGNFVKLLVKDIKNYEVETGRAYNEVTLEYSYQPDGSTTFPE